METAKNKLATAMQKLFTNSNKTPARMENATNDEADFVIESEDGDKFNVHSWVLKLRRTDFFDALLSSDFKERIERTVTIPAATWTVELFVKFLYGFELIEEKIDLFTWKELVQIGGVYDRSIQDAAAEIMMKHLEKTNVFEILAFCKQNEAKRAVEVCRVFIAMNFDADYLLEVGHFDNNPETAVEILKVKGKKNVKTETSDPALVIDSSDDVAGPSGTRKRGRSPRYSRSPSPIYSRRRRISSSSSCDDYEARSRWSRGRDNNKRRR